MPRGRVIPERVKRIIKELYLKHPNLPAKDVQWEVHNTYRKYERHIPDNWPGLNAVQKILHDIRLQHISNPKDTAWSLYTLAEFDIPADALQTVVDAYAITKTWDSEPLTVREALWVARLYRVITDIEELAIASRECSDNERLNEISGKSLPGLVDGDFEIRAITGKPGISYKYLGDGKFQIVILDTRITENFDIVPLPKRVIEAMYSKE
ncbi:hypothetical protein ACFLUJ_09510 [Chloroflexota bacterium]